MIIIQFSSNLIKTSEKCSYSVNSISRWTFSMPRVIISFSCNQRLHNIGYSSERRLIALHIYLIYVISTAEDICSWIWILQSCLLYCTLKVSCEIRVFNSPLYALRFINQEAYYRITMSTAQQKLQRTFNVRKTFLKRMLLNVHHREKGRDLTHSNDKSPFTNRNWKKQSDKTKRHWNFRLHSDFGLTKLKKLQPTNWYW